MLKQFRLWAPAVDDFGCLMQRILFDYKSTMRQLSVNRYKAKVRGVERRLRALDRWVEDFADIEPYHEGRRYFNYRIPVLDRLVSPPTTTKEIQKRATTSLLKAATHLQKSSLRKALPYYRVAVLLVLPRMFYSEVTVFYSEDYYNSFCYSENLLPRL
jgi:hypothetical protein